MKRLLLSALAATALAASPLSAQELPATSIVDIEIECGDAKEIKQFLRDAGAEQILHGKTLNPQAPGGSSILMMNPDGVYTLLLESPDGKHVCMADYGKFSKPGVNM